MHSLLSFLFFKEVILKILGKIYIIKGYIKDNPKLIKESLIK